MPEIKQLWVEPSARMRGAGRTLVTAAVAEAATKGAPSVRLTVWDWWHAAIALYERVGFMPALLMG
jgi:putative acetyltransferase